MSLRSILGRSNRVKKATKPKGASTKPRNSPSASSSSSWTDSLPRSKPSTPRGKKQADEGHEEDDFFDDKLDDCGLIEALGSDLRLRDTTQAIYYIRNHMFSAVPEQAAGLSSTRIAEVLNYRKHLPPIVTVSHIQALLASPSAVEREIAELARSGFLRRIVVARRGDIGETLILSSDFEQLVEASSMLKDTTKNNLLAHLRQCPATQTIERDALSAADIDDLIRAGFVTSHHTGANNVASMSNRMNMFSRPEDKGTAISIETVSRQATGSLGAVGGEAALLNAGGGGGGARNRPSGVATTTTAADLRLAIPGNGTYLKLLLSALDHLVSLLGRSRFREAPETLLKDWWDGGIVKADDRYAAKRSRREFAGILPGQTRKWRQFNGLAFDWILQEAVGSGLLEVFDTGSVGRGIRAVGAGSVR